ncbi:hypothetical protein, partial [Dactylosporangium matsuzakiense]|uniref:hypothetical protein n=1 Tax=Dactylosporangium matsuzakiense TaxID=53360 RepID=UPI0022F3199B
GRPVLTRVVRLLIFCRLHRKFPGYLQSMPVFWLSTTDAARLFGHTVAHTQKRRRACRNRPRQVRARQFCDAAWIANHPFY